MNDDVMFCATCRSEILFEAPPCPDGHDEECPELVCTGCGTAGFAAPVVLWSFTRHTGAGGGARIAPHQRRAA
jgi:hypothetical protein